MEYDFRVNNREKLALYPTIRNNYDPTFNASGTEYFKDVMDYMGTKRMNEIQNSVRLRKTMIEAFKNK